MNLVVPCVWSRTSEVVKITSIIRQNAYPLSPFPRFTGLISGGEKQENMFFAKDCLRKMILTHTEV